MAQLPLPIYVEQVRTDTTHMTALEFGAVMRLLHYYWSSEKPIPKDRAKLIAGTTDAEWEEVRSAVEEYFGRRKDTLTCPWVETALKAAHRKVQANSRAGKASAAARLKAKPKPPKPKQQVKLRALADEIAARYNHYAGQIGWATCQPGSQWSDTRLSQLGRRIKQDKTRAEPEFWNELFATAAKQDWLRDKRFFNLSWLLKSDENIVKVQERQYG